MRYLTTEKHKIKDMHINQIEYDLACRSCKSLRQNGLAMLETEEDIHHMSREELIVEMNNFGHLRCENCNTKGNWLVFKIKLNGNDDIINQFKVNIFKKNGIISGGVENGYFSPIEIELAFMKIRDEIEELEKVFFPIKENGTAFILIDFLNVEPYNRISIFDIDGISINEIERLIENISGTKTTKISKELKKKLENAYEELEKDIVNPLVIAHLETKDKKESIYLIAKHPEEDLYYGILENEYVTKREIAGIPYTNIKNIEYLERPINPFRAKAYINRGDKSNFKLFFENDKLFQKRTIFFHFAKNEGYISSQNREILPLLNFTLGTAGIPTIIYLTKKVEKHELIHNEIKFTYTTDILGLKRFPGIIELFPLLSTYCYKPTSAEHLLSLMQISDNGQLLEFLYLLKKYSDKRHINELVELLNKPESNPNIQESDIDVNTADKNILILNYGAYENIFKKYITNEMLEPFRRKK